MVPAPLFSFACLAGRAASPPLIPAMALLAAAGLGTAWGAGIDGLLLADELRPDAAQGVPGLVVQIRTVGGRDDLRLTHGAPHLPTRAAMVRAQARASVRVVSTVRS